MGDTDLRAKLELLDYQESGGLSFFASTSVSYVNVGLSVVVANRYSHRMFIGLEPLNSGTDGNQGITTDPGASYVRLLRNGSAIAVWQYGSTGVGFIGYPPSAFHFHDAPGVGSHTYSWQGRRISGSTTFSWNNVKTVAYELTN